MFRRAPRHALLALGLVTLCLYGPRLAHAEAELTLSWQAEAGCPDEAWARERLRERLGRVPDQAPSTLAAHASLHRESTGFVLSLHTVQAGAAGDRKLTATRCDELAEAAVLMIALALEQSAPQPTPVPVVVVPITEYEKPPGLTPVPVVPARPPSRRFVVRAAGLVTRGDQPAWGMGAELAAGYHVGFLELELGGFWLAPRTSPAAEGGGKVRMSLWALCPRVCALRQIGRLAFGGCLGAELGRVSGAGQGLAQNQQSHALWPAISLAGRLSLRLGGPLWLASGLGAAVPLDRPRFVSIDGSDGARTRLYEPKPLAGRATLGLEARF